MSSEIHYSLSIRYLCTAHVPKCNEVQGAYKIRSHARQILSERTIPVHLTLWAAAFETGSGIKVKESRTGLNAYAKITALQNMPGNEQYYLLVYDVVQSRRGLPTFRRNEQSACCLPGLLFGPEDGSSTFIRNVGKLPSDYMALHLRRWSVPFTVTAVRTSGTNSGTFIHFCLMISKAVIVAGKSELGECDKFSLWLS